MSRAPLTRTLALLASLATLPLAAQDLLQSRSPAQLLGKQLVGEVLPAEEAFRLQLSSSGSEGLELEWLIAPGHYLYRKSLGVQLPDGQTLGGLELPAGLPIEDEFFGAVEVYYNALRLPLPLDALRASGATKIDVLFQGCAEERYCYPPQVVELALPALPAAHQH
jgi:thiol:disulfide interchange protein DsbD